MSTIPANAVSHSVPVDVKAAAGVVTSAMIGSGNSSSAEDSDDSRSIHSNSTSPSEVDNNLDHAGAKPTIKTDSLTSGRKLWANPKTYAMCALNSPWHTTLFRMQNTMVHASSDFMRSTARYKYLVVPVSTSSISSPMGLGSDSDPVAIDLLGEKTYLADSQQFMLEYGLRLESDIPGVYYFGTSCRGEDTDPMHLNQFFHVECELGGDLNAGMKVADAYIAALVKAMLDEHKEEIMAYAGSVEHLESVLELYTKSGDKFPVVTFDEFLASPELTDDMWAYTVDGEPKYGKKITRKGERMLIKKFGGAVWLTEPDHLSTPFYQAYTGPSRDKSKASDFLIGLGEVMGCGERHESYESVLKALDHHGVDAEDYKWYVDLRREKPMRTVGWGMGIERVLAWVLQIDDVRDTQIVPRFKGVVHYP